MTKFILGLGLLLCACGGSDGNEPEPTVDGLWQTSLPNGCAVTYAFNAGQFSDNVICTLQNGGYAMEIENGVYTKTDKLISLTTQKSSCVAHSQPNGTLDYSLQADQLVLGFSGGTLILERMKAGTVTGGAAIQTGCWDFSSDPAVFTPGPTQKP